MVTTQQIQDLVTKSMESGKAIEVLDWLQQYVGKNISTRLADAANKQFPDEDFRLVRQYGMTHLENRVHRDLRYLPNGKANRDLWNRAISILLSHSEASTPLQACYLTEHNTCYTVGPRRNRTRERSLDHAERLASAINGYHGASSELAEAMKPFHEDRYRIREELIECKPPNN